MPWERKDLLSALLSCTTRAGISSWIIGGSLDVSNRLLAWQGSILALYSDLLYHINITWITHFNIKLPLSLSLWFFLFNPPNIIKPSSNEPLEADKNSDWRRAKNEEYPTLARLTSVCLAPAHRPRGCSRGWGGSWTRGGWAYQGRLCPCNYSWQISWFCEHWTLTFVRHRVDICCKLTPVFVYCSLIKIKKRL